jgi:hypothetical protein
LDDRNLVIDVIKYRTWNRPSTLIILGFSIITVQIFERAIEEFWLSGLLPKISGLDLPIFSLIIALTIIFQSFLLIILHSVPAARKREGLLRYRLYVIATVIQTFIIILLILVSFQVNLDRTYSTNLILTIVTHSYAASIIIIGMLVYRFIRSLLYSRSRIIMVYTFAMIAICLNFSFSLFYLQSQLNVRPEIITVYRDAYEAYYNPSPPILSNAYSFTGYVYFILAWFATILLLQYYSHRIGKIRYWLIVSIPIIYFLSQFIPTVLDDLNIPRSFASSLAFNFVLFTFRAGGGIMFGCAFFILSKNVRIHDIHYFLVFAGLGMMLVFSSADFSSIGYAQFPPFGVGSISYLVVSSYLLFMGLDSCSLRLANDGTIRRTIQKTMKEDELLKGLAASQVEDSIAARVKYLHQNLTQHFQPNESSSLSIHDEDIHDYIREVLQEVKKTGKTGTNGSE